MWRWCHFPFFFFFFLFFFALYFILLWRFRLGRGVVPPRALAIVWAALQARLLYLRDCNYSL
jgi:hypothetical protein